MTWFPPLRLGWINGWVLLAPFFVLYGIALWRLPRSVVSRLYDRTGWTRADYARRLIGLPIAFGVMGLFLFLPLPVGAASFWIGCVLCAAGSFLFFAALRVYARTPADRPATTGVYSISRNPQVLGLILTFAGTAVAVGSWLLLGLVLTMWVGAHVRIMTEEKACLLQYGAVYAAYRNRTARYLGWPRRAPDQPASSRP